VRAALVVGALLLAPALATYGLAEWSSRGALHRARLAFAPHAGAASARRRSEVNESARRLGELMRDRHEAIAALRDHLIGEPLPEWPSDSQWPQATPAFLGQLDGITSRLLADAEQSGDAERADVDLEAAWRVVDALRLRDDLVSALTGRRLALRVAEVARKIDGLGPRWSARFDVEPVREQLLRASRTWCAGMLAAAEHPDPSALLPEDAPARDSALALVGGPSARKTLARRVLESIDGITRLESPSRCEVPPPPARPAAVTPLPWEHDMVPMETLPQRVDVARLHFELTRRVLDLRARRDADPQHRWPTDLGDDGSSGCPRVTFVLRETSPGVLVLEPESPDGPWWIWQYRGTDAMDLRVEMVQPDASPR
jgi:hypothetical protein